MTATIDTNVLVLAVDSSHPRQERARALLDWVAAGPVVFHLFWPALMGFLRIVTHPSIFAHPLSPDDALAAVDRLVGRPHVRVSGEFEEFWPAYRRVAVELKPRGNLVPDAHLVALMQEHGVLKTVRQIAKSPQHVVSIGRDNEGELYVVGYEGMIYKMDFRGVTFR